MYSFSNFEPIFCSMSSSNCCFLICIQIAQEACKVIWCYHLFQSFPQFVVIHTVKGFTIVSEAEFVNICHKYLFLKFCGNSSSGLSMALFPYFFSGYKEYFIHTPQRGVENRHWIHNFVLTWNKPIARYFPEWESCQKGPKSRWNNKSFAKHCEV